MEEVTPSKVPSSDNQAPDVEPVDNIPASMPEATNAAEVNTESVTPESSASEAATEAPVSDVAPAPDEPQSPSEQPEQVESAAPAAMDAQKPKSTMPLIMIIVVLVVLGLAAAAYYAFVNNYVTPDDTPTSKTSTNTETTPAADADTLSDSIDTSLSEIDDTKDYNTNDLSDTTLGL